MIYIVRHGQTALNKSRALQGRSDNPLNDAGRDQARQAGEWVRERGIVFDRVYSSPLIRAVETAALVSGFDDKEIIRDDRLIEMDYGPYEGADLRDPSPELKEFFSDFVNNPAPQGMEPLSSVVSRRADFFTWLKETDLSENILVSTHAIAMKGALEFLTPLSKGSYWKKFIGNCAIYVTDFENGEYTVPYEIEIGKEE